MWTDKHRPNKLSQIYGNEKALEKFREWAEQYQSGNNEYNGIILHGPPGVGKTASAYTIADYMNWETVEMNASDKRTKKLVNEVVGKSSNTHTLTGKNKKMIIVDEADNLHGNYDRGGKKAIKNIVKNSNQPIILIANDYYDLSRTLRNLPDVDFKSLKEKEIAHKLKEICESESIDYTISGLKCIAKNSEGDMRSAINDLQKYALQYDKISKNVLETNKRDKNEEIFTYLNKVFKDETPREVRQNAENIDMTPYELYQWINTNMYTIFNSDEIESAIEQVSKCSLWLGRVRSTQEYRFWRYANDKLTAGMAKSRESKKSGWTRWQPPNYARSSGMSASLVESVALKTSNSMEVTRTEILPYISTMISYAKPEDLAVEFTAWYDWDKDELSEITGSGKNTNKIERVIDKADSKKKRFKIGVNDMESKNNENGGDENDESGDQQGINDFTVE